MCPLHTGWAVAAKDSFHGGPVPSAASRPPRHDRSAPGDTEFGQAGALLPPSLLVAIYLAFSDRVG